MRSPHLRRDRLVRAHRKACVQAIAEKVKSVDEFCEGQAGKVHCFQGKSIWQRYCCEYRGICWADGQGPAQG